MKMNKKGTTGPFILIIYIFMIIVSIIGVIYITYNINDSEAKAKAKKESCNKIGMEYIFIDGTEFCLDKNNQAHYVKIECVRLGFKDYNCNPRLISIGELRTKQGGD